MRGKILSSEYRVPDKLGPLRTLTLLFQHATCVKKTAHEYFVLGSQRYVLIAFKYFFFTSNVLLNLSIQFLAMREKILSLDHYVT